ncbi:MAG: alpha/beta hydrolase [Candidatus Bipolaricaulota bacterium]
MKEKDLRKHGDGPFNIVVIHGGPGALGEMGSVARRLSPERGVLEPFQTAGSIEEQVDELMVILGDHGNPPLTLIGYSWGAWLSIIFSAIYPATVGRIILVGSPPFKEKYATGIKETRLKRLDDEDRQEAERLMKELSQAGKENKEEALTRLAELTRKADSFDPLPSFDDLSEVEIQPEVHRQVWDEAEKVRESGELLELVELVQCSVVAIHGDYDSHPAEGVKEPLSKAAEEFKFILLKDCGHTPWIERKAKDKFYAILEGLLD